MDVRNNRSKQTVSSVTFSPWPHCWDPISLVPYNSTPYFCPILKPCNFTRYLLDHNSSCVILHLYLSSQ